MKSNQLLVLKQKDRPKAVSLIGELPCLGRVAVLTRHPAEAAARQYRQLNPAI
jgi:hypothetical protein